MPFYLTAAALLVLGGPLLIYACAPNQRIREQPAPAPVGWAGAAAIIAGAALLMGWAGPATAVFTSATGAMLVWTLVPPFAAWLRTRRAGR